MRGRHPGALVDEPDVRQSRREIECPSTLHVRSASAVEGDDECRDRSVRAVVVPRESVQRHRPKYEPQAWHDPDQPRGDVRGAGDLLVFNAETWPPAGF